MKAVGGYYLCNLPKKRQSWATQRAWLRAVSGQLRSMLRIFDLSQ